MRTIGPACKRGPNTGLEFVNRDDSSASASMRRRRRALDGDALQWAAGRDAMKFTLGQAVPRTEDPRLLTGRGRYTDDFVLPRLAHACVLRSPHAHARIRSIDVRAARQIPGVSDPSCMA